MLSFFDANFWLSGANYWLSSSLYSKEEKEEGIKSIRRKLEENNISNAIVTNKLALSYDWNVGNEKLLSSNLYREIENLYYAYVLTPDVYFTFDFDNYLKTAFSNKVRLFRFFPKNHFFYLNDFYMKKIFSLLSEKKFPIMLDLKQLDITGNKYFDIDVLERVLDENKDMPLILETSLKQCMFSRYYFPLLERFANLYVEISGLLLIDQIEGYVERYGSKRLIFGSNFPNLPVEITTNRIVLAEIDELDKESIAFNNMSNIIRGIEID